MNLINGETDGFNPVLKVVHSEGSNWYGSTAQEDAIGRVTASQEVALAA